MSRKAVLLLTFTIYLAGTCKTYGGNDPNLVGYWKLDEKLGRIARDSSGSGNDGKFIGGIGWMPTGGKFGGAVNFDVGSIGSQIEIPAKGMRASAGTVALWVYLAEPQAFNRNMGYRFLFSCGHNPNRIQLYMDDRDTKLDLGLGDDHRRHENITILSTKTWYHIALTWEKDNYAVYVNGDEKAAGAYRGLNNLPPIGTIGNAGGDIRQGFHGLIDEVLIFDGALTDDQIAALYNPGGDSSISEPTLLLLSTIRQAEIILKERGPREAVSFLEKKKAEYEQRKEKKTDDTKRPCRALSHDLYLLLAKAKEAAGFPKQEVIAAYEQSLSQLVPTQPDSVCGLLWLFKNTSADTCAEAAKKLIRKGNITSDNIRYIAEDFESNGDWSAFEFFMNTIFSEVDAAAPYAENIVTGLKSEGSWVTKFSDYLRNKPGLIECYIVVRTGLAQKCVGKGMFPDAVEIYRDIVNHCRAEEDKTIYEFKICECIFYEGRYQDAIFELDRFLSRYKAVNSYLAVKALLMETYCHIKLNRFDKASEAFFSLTLEYPESREAAEAGYLLGYSYMLGSKFKQAADIFKVVTQEYPGSSYAVKAEIYLTRIKNMTD